MYTYGGFPTGLAVMNLPAMQETWVWSLSREDPLEEGVSTHSGMLAWRVPWTEEAGGLQSLGSQRVGREHTGIRVQQASQGALAVKHPLANAGGTGGTLWIPGLGRSPGGGHGNLLQYSCLENSTVRGAWLATVHGVSQSQTWLNRLRTHVLTTHTEKCLSSANIVVE